MSSLEEKLLKNSNMTNKDCTKLDNKMRGDE